MTQENSRSLQNSWNGKMDIIGIIPARMGSSRYPGKPMKPICGIPMLGHVYWRTKMSQTIDELYVATCDQEIYEYVRSIDGKVVMTSELHERCSDRVAEAMLKIESERGKTSDIIVMIQGDEPLICPEMIDEAIEPLLIDDSLVITNLMGDIKSKNEWEDPNEVKVVVDNNNLALYFSREAIPSGKKWNGTIPMKKQICIIPFRRDFLLKFNELHPLPLEKIESVDMMRVLEHGFKVKMVPTDFDVYSVDTPEDMAKVEAIMQNDSLLALYSGNTRRTRP